MGHPTDDMKHAGGRPVQYHSLDPAGMARACRKLAEDLRREHAKGMGPVQLTNVEGNHGGGWTNSISRLEAAHSMDRQAERWEAEVRGEERNDLDRRLLGFL
jgi:hypothetical protein